MRMGMAESIDRTVFNGDSGANENTADVTGMNDGWNLGIHLEPSQQGEAETKR